MPRRIRRGRRSPQGRSGPSVRASFPLQPTTRDSESRGRRSRRQRAKFDRPCPLLAHLLADADHEARETRCPSEHGRRGERQELGQRLYASTKRLLEQHLLGREKAMLLDGRLERRQEILGIARLEQKSEE